MKIFKYTSDGMVLIYKVSVNISHEEEKGLKTIKIYEIPYWKVESNLWFFFIRIQDLRFENF